MEKATIFALIVLILLIGLTPLHYAVAGKGNDAYNSKSFDQHIAFIVVATTLELLLCIALLINLFAHCLSRLIQTLFLSIVLVLEFAIVVDVAIVTSQADILRDTLPGRAAGMQFPTTTSTSCGRQEWQTRSCPSSSNFPFWQCCSTSPSKTWPLWEQGRTRHPPIKDSPPQPETTCDRTTILCAGMHWFLHHDWKVVDS